MIALIPSMSVISELKQKRYSRKSEVKRIYDLAKVNDKALFLLPSLIRDEIDVIIESDEVLSEILCELIDNNKIRFGKEPSQDLDAFFNFVKSDTSNRYFCIPFTLKKPMNDGKMCYYSFFKKDLFTNVLECLIKSSTAVLRPDEFVNDKEIEDVIKKLVRLQMSCECIFVLDRHLNYNSCAFAKAIKALNKRINVITSHPNAPIEMLRDRLGSKLIVYKISRHKLHERVLLADHLIIEFNNDPNEVTCRSRIWKMDVQIDGNAAKAFRDRAQKKHRFYPR